MSEIGRYADDNLPYTARKDTDSVIKTQKIHLLLNCNDDIDVDNHQIFKSP